jgi:hypothetical protein
MNKYTQFPLKNFKKNCVNKNKYVNYMYADVKPNATAKCANFVFFLAEKLHVIS